MFFRVVGDDGKVLWTSGPINTAEGYGEVSRERADRKFITLENSTANPTTAHGVWYEPRFATTASQ